MVQTVKTLSDGDLRKTNESGVVLEKVYEGLATGVGAVTDTAAELWDGVTWTITDPAAAVVAQVVANLPDARIKDDHVPSQGQNLVPEILALGIAQCVKTIVNYPMTVGKQLLDKYLVDAGLPPQVVNGATDLVLDVNGVNTVICGLVNVYMRGSVTSVSFSPLVEGTLHQIESISGTLPWAWTEFANTAAQKGPEGVPGRAILNYKPATYCGPRLVYQRPMGLPGFRHVCERLR